VKAIFDSRKHHRLKRVSIFLIVIALVAGIVGCASTPTEYELTMAENPTAGGTATDQTNTSPYAKGAQVNIKAEAAPGYKFANWSAPAGKFDDENLAETTFTMPAQNVTVTANFVAVYNLTMAANPVGGGTAIDETNESPYTEGTVVSIKALAAAGYQFFSWTAPAGTFDDANAEETNFIMPAQNVTVTANFVGPLDHFKFYEADSEKHIGEVVYLEDQFGTFTATVESAEGFGNPAEKVHGDVTTPISNPDHHLTVYSLTFEEEPQTWLVKVNNQFGEQMLTVSGPYGLAVPTQKEGHNQPVGLDHYLLYEVIESSYIGEVSVNLIDQFFDEAQIYDVYEPLIFANPVKKTVGDEVTEIWDPEAHLVFYGVWVVGGEYFEAEVEVANQFGEEILAVYQDEVAALAVPSEKIDWEPLLFDHFECYEIDPETAPYVDAVVELEDQFHEEPFEALVGEGIAFCNPVGKWHDGWLAEILNEDNHLMLYDLYHEEEPQEWFVEVDNQFGEQMLTVSNPVALAVPTQKLFPYYHEKPVGLDHYLLYEVTNGPSIEVVVDLEDEFNYEPEVLVYEPAFFANPVRKTHGNNVTEIENPDEHLVFYWIEGETLDPEVEVEVWNQFDLQSFNVAYPGLLAVPSQKTDFFTEEPLAVAAVLGGYNSQLTNLLRVNGIWAEERDWSVISDIDDYDVVVVNEPDDPGETTFLDFLDAADANGVGVVFTSSYDIDDINCPWGISLLEWYLGDPPGQDEDWESGDVYYKVTQEHAIFDGWDVGDEITIITGGYQDHTLFWNYTGTTIAEVGSESGGIRGDAVAVGTYCASKHVLLASLGPQVDTHMSHWTKDGKTIFINAVCFAAGI